MVKPFRRKGGKELSPIADDDELIEVIGEIDDKTSEIVLSSEKPELDNNGSNDQKIEDDIPSLLKKSSQTVIRTCLDIRRADNVLIVCDPTTGEIGQSLHEAAIERTDRVLLIVMPKVLVVKVLVPKVTSVFTRAVIFVRKTGTNCQRGEVWR